MATALINTGVQFPNSTIQTTAGTGSVTSVAAGTGLSGGTITTSGTISLVTTLGAVGTYGFMTGNAYINNPGGTAAGSTLRYANALGYPYTGTVPSGTWQCMGRTRDCCIGPAQVTTMWVRIA